jgi:DNA repair protein RecO (recombination protein O)
MGDADLFCILLTNTRGRVSVCAKGVRKPHSTSSGALQSFQHIRIDLSEHSSGLYLRSAMGLCSFESIRCDMQKFMFASRGAELLLHLLHDTEPHEEIFILAQEYFRHCDEKIHTLLFSAFQLSLFKELGLLPDLRDVKHSPSLQSFLQSQTVFSDRLKVAVTCEEKNIIASLCENLLMDHLSFPLRSSRLAQAL